MDHLGDPDPIGADHSDADGSGRLTERAASFDRSGRYRWWLRRRWSAGPELVFVGLNPSTADGTGDDPTIRRVMGFAQAHGYGAVYVVNLFALRTPSPRVLFQGEAPEGTRNRRVLYAALRQPAVWLAWGNHGLGHDITQRVLRRVAPERTWCLGLTGRGAPKHPLYVRNGTPLIPWSGV